MGAEDETGAGPDDGLWPGADEGARLGTLEGGITALARPARKTIDAILNCIGFG